MDTSGRSTFVPRCLPCFSFGGLATASPNSATNSDAFGIAIRNLMGGTARQGALPTSLNHDRRYIAFQRVGNLWFEPPVDRKSVVWGKSVSVRVDLGGRRIFKKKKNYNTHIRQHQLIKIKS